MEEELCEALGGMRWGGGEAGTEGGLDGTEEGEEGRWEGVRGWQESNVGGFWRGFISFDGRVC